MKTKLKNKGKLIFYICLIIFPIVQFIIFYGIVNFRSILFAFQDYTTEKDFVWSFGNFKDIFVATETNVDPPYVLRAALNSILVYFFRLVTGTGLGLVFSNYIYKKCLGHKVFQIMLFLPQILSAVVMAIVLRATVELSVLNEILPTTISLENNRLLSGMMFTFWTGYGVSVLMYTSAMSGIDTSIVESAQLDGISPIKEFIFITLPSIYPTIVSFLVIGLAALFVEQEHIYTLFGNNGYLSGKESMTMGYYLYYKAQSQGIHYPTYGYLSALGILLSAITIPITFGAKKLLTKYGPSVE